MPGAAWLAPAALCALAVVGLGAGGAAGAGQAPAPSGPDVSSHQHPNGHGIDWQRVHDAGAGFTFVKATEGHTYTNAYFGSDFADAGGHGLVRSAYHYARPALPLTSATQQADYFLSVTGTASTKGDLPTTLDMEESGGLGPADLVSWTQAFLQRVTQQTGRPPIIYTYPYFWRHAMADSHDFTRYPLWIADYSKHSSPTLPGGWQTWTFWQTTSTAREPGIATAVDLSRFNGDDAALQRLATPAPPSPTPAPLLPLPLPTASLLPH